MAKQRAPIKMVNKKGKEKKEYPKLVRVSDTKKVLVNNADEEAALDVKTEAKAKTETKPAGNGWGNQT